LVGVTIIAGLTIRLAPLGLPNTLTKYGGSLLWAMMIYWIVSTARLNLTLTAYALMSGTVALTAELFKRYHTPLLDAFRITLPGKLLLGRVFSLWDLLTYAIAVVVGVFADCAIRSRKWR
jgi:uncharacterized membrane protein YcgQ (UPF0703/DUF1980 family)